MPLDKLTWLRKKLGFDVEAAKAKKKAAGGAPMATAAAALTAGAMAGTSAAGVPPAWQSAQPSPNLTAAAGPRMGRNRQTAPPPPPIPNAGYMPVDGLPAGASTGYFNTLGEALPKSETSETGEGETYSTMDETEGGTLYSTDLDLRGAPEPPNISIDKASVREFPTVDASNTDYAMGVEGATGMKGKSAGDEYLGEHNEAGWRNKPWQVNPGDTGITTKIHTEEERAKSTLKLQDDGSYKTGDGRDVQGDENIGYAMDPKTGDMATFSEGMRLGGQNVGFNQGVADFKKGKGDLEVTHHTTALGGDVMLDENNEPILDMRGRPVMKSREVASAGFVKFNFRGEMISISNSSGHYKPSVSMLLQAVEHLTKQGAFFEDEIADANGNAVEPDSKPGQLFAAVQAKLKQKAPLLQLAQSKTAELEKATDEEEKEKLAKEIEALSQQLESLSAELEGPSKILGKLGIGPTRRIREDANVEISEVKEGMTGVDVRLKMTTTNMNADEFLKSGGNPEQLARKKTMMEELEEKTAGKRETLDRMAEVRSARVGRETGDGGPTPTHEDIEEALEALKTKPPAQTGGGTRREEQGEGEEGETSEPKESGGTNYLEQTGTGYGAGTGYGSTEQKGSTGTSYHTQVTEDDDEEKKDSGGTNYLDQTGAGYGSSDQKKSGATTYFETTTDNDGDDKKESGATPYLQTGTNYDPSPNLKN